MPTQQMLLKHLVPAVQAIGLNGPAGPVVAAGGTEFDRGSGFRAEPGISLLCWTGWVSVAGDGVVRAVAGALRLYGRASDPSAALYLRAVEPGRCTISTPSPGAALPALPCVATVGGQMQLQTKPLAGLSHQLPLNR